MTKNTTRALAAWLCTLMILPAVVSCGEAAKTEEQTTAANTAAPAETTEAVDPIEKGFNDAVAGIPAVDYEGKTFTVLCRSDEFSPDWVSIDVDSDEENGDPINDSVFQRNSILEEKMNIEIVSNPVMEPFVEAKKQISAGDSTFEIMTDGLSMLSLLIPEGYLLDLKDIPQIELSQPWWDQQMNKDLTIGNKQFYATGDISIMDNYGTWCLMFNKDIANDYDLGDLYEIVNSGKWTLDRMHDMAKSAAADINGNGEMDPEDQWGLMSEEYNHYGFYASAGERLISKDADDLPVLSGYSDRAVSVIDKVAELHHDHSCTFIATNDIATNCNFTNSVFENGRALFIYGGMWLISRYRGSDVNFGIIPAPKFDEAQESYHSTFSYANCTAYAIPTTAPDTEYIGNVMESMAELSKYTLTPAYYDISLKGKFIRDEESADMLDIILANRSYDLGIFFNWGHLFGKMLTLAHNENEDFASIYAAQEKMAKNDIEKYIEAISKEN